MIERQFVSQKIKEFAIQDYISKNLKNVGHSHTKIVKTPLGEKIIIFASSPGLIVGRKGANIRELTETLKREFKLENPQIEIAEVENINLDPGIVAEKISSYLERFGTTKFKGIGHMVLSDVMEAGGLGVEVVISGKIPSSRAKSWRFYQGYLKKCGDIAMNGVRIAHTTAELKSGTIGIKVSIMPPDVKLPDRIKFIDEKEIVIEEVKPKEEEKKKQRKPRAKKPKKDAIENKPEEKVEAK